MNVNLHVSIYSTCRYNYIYNVHVHVYMYVDEDIGINKKSLPLHHIIQINIL